LQEPAKEQKKSLYDKVNKRRRKKPTKKQAKNLGEKKKGRWENSNNRAEAKHGVQTTEQGAKRSRHKDQTA